MLKLFSTLTKKLSVLLLYYRTRISHNRLISVHPPWQEENKPYFYLIYFNKTTFLVAMDYDI